MNIKNSIKITNCIDKILELYKQSFDKKIQNIYSFLLK